MERLTNQQRTIVNLLVEGYSYKEISSTLYISNKTTKNHMSAIIKKLGVRDKTEVVIYYYKEKIKILKTEIKTEKSKIIT